MATSFNMIKKGYDPKEVQDFIGLLEKELAEYKSKEQFISQALVEAQVLAKNVIGQAEDQATLIEKDALEKLQSVRSKIHESKDKLFQFEEDYSSFIKRFSASFGEEELNKLINSLDNIYATLEVSSEETEDDELDSAI